MKNFANKKNSKKRLKKLLKKHNLNRPKWKGLMAIIQLKVRKELIPVEANNGDNYEGISIWISIWISMDKYMDK